MADKVRKTEAFIVSALGSEAALAPVHCTVVVALGVLWPCTCDLKGGALDPWDLEDLQEPPCDFTFDSFYDGENLTCGPWKPTGVPPQEEAPGRAVGFFGTVGFDGLCWGKGQGRTHPENPTSVLWDSVPRERCVGWVGPG